MSDTHYGPREEGAVSTTTTKSIAIEILYVLNHASEPALWTGQITNRIDGHEHKQITRVLRELAEKGYLGTKSNENNRLWWID